MQQITNALQAAQNSQNVGAQDTLLHREIKLDNKAIGWDQAKMRAITRQLAGTISEARRSQLMQDRLKLLQDMGTLRNDIGSAMSQLQNLAGGSSTTGAFDLAPGGANITAPTVYDVRHSLQAGRMAAIHARHPGRQQVHHHGNTTVTNHYVFQIHKAAAVDETFDKIDRYTGSGLHARMRATGMRGT